MPPRARECEQLLDRRRHLDHLRLGRAAPAHRDHDHVAVACQQAGEVRRDGGLPHALELERVEAEVGAEVREPGGERARRPAEALFRSEHGLVGEVDDELRVAEAVDERHAVIGALAQLLRPADEDRAHPVVRHVGERISDDGRVVLAVDERHGLHLCDVTSRSIRPVYFSNSPVAMSNWMIRSCPWNG